MIHKQDRITDNYLSIYKLEILKFQTLSFDNKLLGGV